MLPEVAIITLEAPSARLIRDRKLEMQATWEAKYEMPSVVSVRRGYDLTKDVRFATITVRSAVPTTMKWNV